MLTQEELVQKTAEEIEAMIREERAKGRAGETRSTKANQRDLLLRDIVSWLDMTPFYEFYESMKREVIGQEGLRLVCANIYHYLDCVSSQKIFNGNMMIAAPSGSGKTATYRALREYFIKAIPNMPVVMIDTASITPAGYRGSNIDDAMEQFFKMGTKYPIGLAFLDEFDKRLQPPKRNGANDLNGEVQNGLLSMLEGSPVYNKCGHAILTDDIMFFGLGSFDVFRKEREEKANIRSVGFGAATTGDVSHFENITRKDMIEFGGSYELIGRFPFVVNYGKLSYEAVDKIIEKNLWEICNSYNVPIVITDEYMEVLHDSANSSFGCRLLNSMLQNAAMVAYQDYLLEGGDIDGSASTGFFISGEYEAETINFVEYMKEHKDDDVLVTKPYGYDEMLETDNCA